jgi:hypothetical protein
MFEYQSINRKVIFSTIFDLQTVQQMQTPLLICYTLPYLIRGTQSTTSAGACRPLHSCSRYCQRRIYSYGLNRRCRSKICLQSSQQLVTYTKKVHAIGNCIHQRDNYPKQLTRACCHCWRSRYHGAVDNNCRRASWSSCQPGRSSANTCCNRRVIQRSSADITVLVIKR